MIDLAALKSAAEAGDGAEEVPITRRCLAQIVDELTAGRAAEARVGQLISMHGGKL